MIGEFINKEQAILKLQDAIRTEDCVYTEGLDKAVDIIDEIPTNTATTAQWCFNCCHDTMLWKADETFEEYGEEGDGIYRTFECFKCGAKVIFKIPDKVEMTNE